MPRLGSIQSTNLKSAAVTNAGRLVDVVRNQSITTSKMIISTDYTRFGSASMLLPEVSLGLSTGGGAELDLQGITTSTTNLIIEFWKYTPSSITSNYFDIYFELYGDANNYMFFSSNGAACRGSINGTGFATSNITDIAVTTDQWEHYVFHINVSNGSVRIARNGVKSVNNIFLGSLGSFSSPFTKLKFKDSVYGGIARGYMDEIRITTTSGAYDLFNQSGYTVPIRDLTGNVGSPIHYFRATLQQKQNYPSDILSADEAFKFTFDNSNNIVNAIDRSARGWVFSGPNRGVTDLQLNAEPDYGFASRQRLPHQDDRVNSGNYYFNANAGNSAGIATLNQFDATSGNLYVNWHNQNITPNSWTLEANVYIQNQEYNINSWAQLFSSGLNSISLLYSPLAAGSDPLLPSGKGTTWQVQLGITSNRFATSGSLIKFPAHDITYNKWHHIVITCETNAPRRVYKVYVDGVLQNRGVSDESGLALWANDQQYVTYVGTKFVGPMYYGLDNIRLMKGTPFPKMGFNKQKTSLNSYVYDVAKNQVPSFNGLSFVSDRFRSGRMGSMLITSTSSKFDIYGATVSGIITVEFWKHLQITPGTSDPIIELYHSGTGGGWLQLFRSGALWAGKDDNITGSTPIAENTWPDEVGAWVHFILVYECSSALVTRTTAGRNGIVRNTHTFGGVAVRSTPLSALNFFGSGDSSPYNGKVSGNFDEIRVSRGDIYNAFSGSGSYTVPTQPLIPDDNTLHLFKAV